MIDVVIVNCMTAGSEIEDGGFKIQNGWFVTSFWRYDTS